MTVLMGAFEQVVDIDNLVRAHSRAMRGKRSNPKANAYNYNMMSELLAIRQDLIDKTYQPREYRRRIIREPKTRLIEAPDFRDRVVHHSIYNVLNPFYERHFIADSYACRVGRGIHGAARRVQHFLRQSHGPLYVCQLDISKYFASINHAKLKEILAKRVADPNLTWLLGVIIDSSQSGHEHDALFPADSPYHTKGPRGIPIGNLTSQVFANIYLHEVDMFAKQELKIRSYVRYMDDILFFGEDKLALHALKQRLVQFLHDELYLTVNPRKVRLYPTRIGVEFVGYKIFAGFMRVRGSSLRRFRKKFHKQMRRYYEGHTSRRGLLASWQAYVAHIRHGDSRSLRMKLQRDFEDQSRVMAFQAILDHYKT